MGRYCRKQALWRQRAAALLTQVLGPTKQPTDWTSAVGSSGRQFQMQNKMSSYRYGATGLGLMRLPVSALPVGRSACTTPGPVSESQTDELISILRLRVAVTTRLDTLDDRRHSSTCSPDSIGPGTPV